MQVEATPVRPVQVTAVIYCYSGRHSSYLYCNVMVDGCLFTRDLVFHTQNSALSSLFQR